MAQTKTIYLSLGSNLGDRGAHLARAISELALAGIRVVRQSSLYATEPVDAPTQQWFLNCVVEAETEVLPRQLLRIIQHIERRLGRKRLTQRGPRAIDIDILIYGTNIVRTPELEIPHPRLSQRRFVLIPLVELAPSLRHPALHRSVTELLATTDDRSQVRRWHNGAPTGGR